MSISLFVESVTDSGKAQTLLVPSESDVLMFHRLSNGQRGRGQAWQVVSDVDTLPDYPVTSQPNGVLITERDVANASIGNITNLSVKALTNPAIPADFDLPHYALVAHQSRPLSQRSIPLSHQQ